MPVPAMDFIRGLNSEDFAQTTTLNQGVSMDNVTLIRIVSGVLAAGVFAVLILRMRKTTSR
jgi:hypothetical protein